MTEIPRKPTFPKYTLVIEKLIERIQNQVEENVIPVSTGIYTYDKLKQKLQAIPKPQVEDYQDKIFFQIIPDVKSNKKPGSQIQQGNQNCIACGEQFTKKNTRVMCNFCGINCCTLCIPIRKRLNPLSKDGSGERYNICSKCDLKFLNLQMSHKYIQNRTMLEQAINKITVQLSDVTQSVRAKTMLFEQKTKLRQRNKMKIAQLKKERFDLSKNTLAEEIIEAQQQNQKLKEKFLQIYEKHQQYLSNKQTIQAERQALKQAQKIKQEQQKRKRSLEYKKNQQKIEKQNRQKQEQKKRKLQRQAFQQQQKLRLQKQRQQQQQAMRILQQQAQRQRRAEEYRRKSRAEFNTQTDTYVEQERINELAQENNEPKDIYETPIKLLQNQDNDQNQPTAGMKQSNMAQYFQEEQGEQFNNNFTFQNEIHNSIEQSITEKISQRASFQRQNRNKTQSTAQPFTFTDKNNNLQSQNLQDNDINQNNDNNRNKKFCSDVYDKNYSDNKEAHSLIHDSFKHKDQDQKSSEEQIPRQQPQQELASELGQQEMQNARYSLIEAARKSAAQKMVVGTAPWDQQEQNGAVQVKKCECIIF